MGGCYKIKTRKHPLLNTIKQKYFDYLIQTQQHKIADNMKEMDGYYLCAVNFYLDNGFYSTALNLVIKHKIPLDAEVIDEFYHILTQKQNDHENAGLLYEYLDDISRAFNIYMEGHIY